MKLVQKILSHGLFIAFVVAAFFLYTKRAELFPQWFAKGGSAQAVASSDQSTGAPAEHVTRPKPEKIIDKQPVTPVPSPVERAMPSGQVPVDGGATDETPAQPPAETAEPEASMPPAAEPATDSGAEPESPAQSADANAAPETDETVVPADNQPATETATAEEQPPVQAADASAATAEVPPQDNAVPAEAGTAPVQSASDAQQLQAQLGRARALYWSQDMNGAAQIYKSLSQAHPDNADVWGEAGNFYYSRQQREQAADAYAHAFDLLVDQGQAQRASQLVGAMYQLDQDKARAMEQQLKQSGAE